MLLFVNVKVVGWFLIDLKREKAQEHIHQQPTAQQQQTTNKQQQQNTHPGRREKK